ncbi:MAG: hypothetical protein ACXV76_10350 [Halobacteriota archaeon]
MNKLLSAKPLLFVTRYNGKHVPIQCALLSVNSASRRALKETKEPEVVKFVST